MIFLFCVHIKIHASQTLTNNYILILKFCIHIKLHASQTQFQRIYPIFLFCIHIKIHTSQTTSCYVSYIILFCIHIKIHTSQTKEMFYWSISSFVSILKYILLKPQKVVLEIIRLQGYVIYNQYEYKTSIYLYYI